MKILTEVEEEHEYFTKSWVTENLPGSTCYQYPISLTKVRNLSLTICVVNFISLEHSTNAHIA